MIAVTTVGDAPEAVTAHARERAAALGLPFRERAQNLTSMLAPGIEGFLVYGKRGPLLWTGAGSHAFHTGTAALRILQLARGGRDRLCALLPGRGCTILDCTFGEGKDSIVFSWYTGAEGHVTALEKSPALYEIGREGLAHFEDSDPSVTAALRRIELRRADFRDFLKAAPPKSWDVVYLDPMFRHPVKEEINRRDAFRAGACYDELDEAVLRAAARAARVRVIVKERPFSALFQSGLFTSVQHHKGQTTAYGMMETIGR